MTHPTSRTPWPSWLALLLVSLLCWLQPALAKGNPPAVSLTLDGGSSVQLTLPEGFTALSKDEMASKFPRGNPPTAVWGNARRTVTVAITDSPQKVRPDQLPELKTAMEQMLPRLIPQLNWLERSLLPASAGGGREWIRFELTSAAIDTDIHNLMYLSSHRGRMWGVNYNATKDSFAAHRAAFEASFASIRFSEN